MRAFQRQASRRRCASWTSTNKGCLFHNTLMTIVLAISEVKRMKRRTPICLLTTASIIVSVASKIDYSCTAGSIRRMRSWPLWSHLIARFWNSRLRSLGATISQLEGRDIRLL
jgi:hypothetical protein